MTDKTFRPYSEDLSGKLSKAYKIGMKIRHNISAQNTVISIVKMKKLEKELAKEIEKINTSFKVLCTQLKRIN